MPQPERLPGTPEFRIKLPKDGGEARGHLLTEFGGNGTHKFLLQKGSTVAAEAWPGLGDHARRTRAELRADGALVDVPPIPAGRRRLGDGWRPGTSTCNSSSAAAALVYGYDASGPESWRTVEGHPLADYLSTGWRAPRKAWLVRGSNVSGHNLVRQLWLEEGVVSLAAAHLPPLEESDPTKSALRRFVEEGYEGAASYNQKRGLVDELHAFLSQMRVGDTVCHHRRRPASRRADHRRRRADLVSGRPVQSAAGPSTGRRTSHPYEELPEEVQQKLSVQHDVVDLTVSWTRWTGSTAQTGAHEAGDRAGPSSPPAERPARAGTVLPDITGHLAAELLVHDVAWLEEMRDLLSDERQLIFYGPPGTGKTYLALKLAEYLGGGPSRSSSCSSTRRTPTRTSSRDSGPEDRRRGRWPSG